MKKNNKLKNDIFTDRMAQESFIFTPSVTKDSRYNHNKIYPLIKPNVKLTTKKQSLGMR